MTSLYDWTYNQYVYAAGVLRIRPEELPQNGGAALLAIKDIWYGSYMGRGVEPSDTFSDGPVEAFFVRIVREAWDDVTRCSVYRG